MTNTINWNKIDPDNPTTLPEVNKSVLICSEEGYVSVEKRRKGEDFIYSDSTDTGCAIGWAYLDFNEIYKLVK